MKNKNEEENDIDLDDEHINENKLYEYHRYKDANINMMDKILLK